ncbi:MAG: hypothetical protein SFV20_12100 [Sphingopyxis sp.]|nr:hypothetical protein [Sphingopyxis sp.]
MRPVKPAKLQPLIVTINETCRLIGFSRAGIHRIIGDGKSTMRRIGRRTPITRACIAMLFTEPP